ncbi:hypothetical protein GCM10009828_080360 [Actinoplanes couchii]|uniref:Uncharacterized protein n=1 Tax=Actinoplanes couchii TaxID=403638 RepID=A0ABQ3XK51_9ACTN|nr:hypothetical protein Aco03nite_072870 [Actinoplanes couchii]
MRPGNADNVAPGIAVARARPRGKRTARLPCRCRTRLGAWIPGSGCRARPGRSSPRGLPGTNPDPTDIAVRRPPTSGRSRSRIRLFDGHYLSAVNGGGRTSGAFDSDKVTPSTNETSTLDCNA